MVVTNIDNQSIRTKEKVKVFFEQSMKYRAISEDCIVKDKMAILLDKWSLFVIYNLAYFGTMRFSTLKTKIRRVSGRMLSVTLKKLESHDVVKRKVYAEVPPRVEYELTEYGLDLAEKAIEMNQWLLDRAIQNADIINAKE